MAAAVVVVKAGGDTPSMVSVNVLLLPEALLTAMPTGWMPATVALAAGAVNEAVRVAGCTVIRRVGGLGSLAPALSVTISETS